MSTTGLQELNWTTKRIVGLADWRDHFYAKLIADIHGIAVATFKTGGVMATQMNLLANGADKFKLSPKSDVTDGLGHIMTPNVELGEAVQFENASAVQYFVALHFAQRPRGYAQNPRTGQPDILYFEDSIGEQGTPNAVVDNGNGTLTLTVDSVTEPGVKCAGRKVVVWKLVPGVNANSEVICIETCTVTWDGVNNKITTAANFGQGASPSTVAAAYGVTCLGPTVKRNTDLSVAAGYAFVGKVTGAGAGVVPSVFSMAGQNVIDSTLADLNQITRVDSHGHVKVSVRGDVSDSGEPQIEVLDSSGNLKFTVDEAGNVDIRGNLLVRGTETIQNVTTINTDEIVGGNLTVGDADTDVHTVKGTWKHLFGGSSIAVWVDGASGKVGFGVQPGTLGYTRHFTVLNDAEFAADVHMDDTLDVGGDLTVQGNIFGLNDVEAQTSIVHSVLHMDALALVDGSLVRVLGGTKTLGISTNPWDQLWAVTGDFAGAVTFETTTDHKGISTFENKLVANADNTVDLGDATHFFRDGFLYSVSLKENPAVGATGGKFLNRITKPIPPKAWAHILLTGTSTPNSDPTINVVDGANIAGVLVGNQGTNGFFRVSVQDVFADTNYICLAEQFVTAASFARALEIRPVDTDGVASKTTGTAVFEVKDRHDTKIVPSVGSTIVLADQLDLRNLGSGRTVEIFVAFFGRQ